jgi:hypothetical protein
MNSINQFQYIYSNLSLYQFHADWITFAASLIGGIILMGICYIVIRIAAFYNIVYHADRALAHKKKTL